jgi:hypothetical protein
MLVFKVCTSITVLPPAPEAGDPSRVNLNVINLGGAAPPLRLPNPKLKPTLDIIGLI